MHSLSRSLLPAFRHPFILSAPDTLTGSQVHLVPTLMAGILPEHWATTNAVLELLANIMKEPFGDHTVAVHDELNGPLLDVHVAVIFRLLAKK